MSKFFTISIGSNGSLVLLNSKKKILQKLFYKDINDEKSQSEITNLLNKNKKLPVYMILDNVGQNYSKKSFPDVNFFDLQSLVKRKFNYEIPKDDLKDKRFLGKNKRNKNWEYMFISSPIDEFMSAWLNLLNTVENVLAGIYMLPLETENVLKKLKNKTKIKTKGTSWDIILTENEVCGFREITFINGKLAFTRILTENLTDQTKFNVQFNSNITRNIEYLRRFYNDFDPNNLRVYTITNENTKDFINGIDIKTNLIIKPFSYKEFATIFGLEKKIKNFLNYGDVLFEELIMFNKKIISFSTKDMKQIAVLSLLSHFFSKVIFGAFGLLILAVIFSFISFTRYTYKIEDSKKTYKKVQKNMEEKKIEKFGDGISNLDEIIDITSFYTDLNNVNTNPFDFLIKLSSIFKNNELLINTITWRLNNFQKNNLSIKFKKSISINSLLINGSGRIDDLFRLYENVNATMKNSLIEYNITFSELPKNINFNTTYSTFPLKINLMEK